MSIAALILAGLVPALVLTICNLVAAYAVAVKRGYPAGTFPGWNIVLHSLAAALPGLFVVVIIVAGILSGVFTATESASVAVLYALVITVFVYRSLSWADFLKAAARAVKKTGVVLLLIGVSAVLGYLMSLYSVAEATGAAISAITTTPWIVFLLVNIILFLLGTFLDMAATILICTPIFLPICMQFGMDPVQFGMMLLINARSGAQHAAGGDHAVRGLRDRRDIGRAGDEDDSPVLPVAHRGAADRHLRAGVLDVAAANLRLPAQIGP